MKKQVLGLTLLAACMSTNALAAAPVANIQVNGNIKPPTCTVNGIEQSEVIFDHGRTSLGLIPQDTAYRFSVGTSKNEVTIQCDTQTYLSFTSSTPYPYTGSVNNPYKSIIALVDAADTSKIIGHYGFLVAKSTIFVDGNVAALSSTKNNSTSSNTYLSLDGSIMGWTKTKLVNSSTDSWDWIPGQEFKMTIENSSTYTQINSKKDLDAAGVDTTDGFDFIGEQVLTFNFGV